VVRFLICAFAGAASIAYADEMEERVHKSVKVNSSTKLVLHAEFGAVRARPATGTTAEVDVFFRGSPPSRSEFDRILRDFTLDVDQDGADIRVTGRFKDGRKPYMNDPVSFLSWLLGGSVWLRQIEYDVAVPQQLSVKLSTSGGSISAEGLKKPVNVRTSGGSIHLDNIYGDVDAATSGGSVSVDQVSGFVNAHTSGGAISLHDVTGGVDASTSGGSVTAFISGQPSKDCRLSTSGGGISVHLDRDVHVDLDASTSGGGISTDFAVPYSGRRHPSALRAALNGGGPLLYLHTSGGGISVHQANSTAELRGRSAVN
jgi:hypothetical protein